MNEKIKKILHFITNPRLLLCVGIAWMITNGWSYILFAVGTYFGITWMTAVGGAYLAFLWLPISPEKIVTFTIALALLRWWFPNDQKTLAVVKNFFENSFPHYPQVFPQRKQNKPIENAEFSMGFEKLIQKMTKNPFFKKVYETPIKTVLVQ